MAKPRLLVVEDEMIIAYQISDDLKLLGYHVDKIVNSGEDAILAVKDTPPDLVLMDIKLSGEMSGIEAGREIRHHYHIPIIYLTANTDPATIEEAKSTQPFGYLFKPYDLKEMNAAIQMALQQNLLENAIRQSEEKMAQIVNGTPIPTFVIDTEHKITHWNRSCENMCGILANEALGTKNQWMAFYHDERPVLADYILMKNADERIGQQYGGKCIPSYIIPGAFEGEDFFPDLGEKGKWLYFTAAPLIDSRGHLIGAIETIQDVTERKSAEQTVHESLERFRHLFTSNIDGVVLLNESLKVVDINPAAQNLFGFSKEKLMEEGAILFLKPSLREDFFKRLEGSKREREISFTRLECVNRAGEVRFATIRGKWIKFSGKSLLSLTFHDETEKVRMEDESRNFQAKMIHANKMTALGTLVSGIAHEINNPNNFIMFNAPLLLKAWQDIRPVLDEYAAKHADFSVAGLSYDEMRDIFPQLIDGINDGAGRIMTIVSNLKDFVRPDNAGLQGEIDIADSIQRSTAILSHQISRHTHHFQVKCPESFPRVRGNSQQFEQVLINLILNALQALPYHDRGVSIECAQDKNDGTVSISIMDEGQGMTPEQMERITEPFFTTKQNQGGTGLGLSISYSIIREHGGNLEFVSDPNQGTRVTITLPVL